jgi:hypothetical protein
MYAWRLPDAAWFWNGAPASRLMLSSLTGGQSMYAWRLSDAKFAVAKHTTLLKLTQWETLFPL